jgi:hypothetical protein
MKNKGLFLLLLNLAFAFSTKAQDYNTGIGIRIGGLNSGITVRHFFNPSNAGEGILSFGHKSFVITGLYEKFLPIKNAEGLHGFVGGGAHIGFFRYGGSYYVYRRHGNIIYVDEVNESRAVGGLDFIFGLNYKIKGAPIDLSLDIKPFVDFFEFPTGYFDGALSFRFVF